MKSYSEDEKAPPKKEKTSSDDSGVRVPEEFQKRVTAVIKECSNREMLSFIRECVFAKENEMMKNNVPEVYSDTDEPKD